MISKYIHEGADFIDIESPTEEEIAYIFEEYDVPIFIKENLKTTSQKDLIKLDNGYIFAYLGIQIENKNTYQKNKLIIIANNEYVLFLHDNPIEGLQNFKKEMELDALEVEKLFKNDSRLLIAHLLKNLYSGFEKQSSINEARIFSLKKQSAYLNKKVRFWKISTLVLIIILVIISLYVAIRI